MCLSFCIVVQVSSDQHPAFQDIRASVLQLFSPVKVVPALFVAASDSRHFWGCTDQIFRFSPVTMHASETAMVYHMAEYTSIASYHLAYNLTPSFSFHHLPLSSTGTMRSLASATMRCSWPLCGALSSSPTLAMSHNRTNAPIVSE